MSFGIGKVATTHWKAIFFMVMGLCLAGVYAASSMPSSVFPQTNFPRVTIMVDNGEMPADEMMATITKPIEVAMKDVPGVVSIRSNTGRGSSVVNVFFSWSVDMDQTELHVRSRLSQVRSSLPASVDARAFRLTFSVFPIAGISLTAGHASPAESRYDVEMTNKGLRRWGSEYLTSEQYKTRAAEARKQGLRQFGSTWVTPAQFDALSQNRAADMTVTAEDLIKPQFLRIPGVASVELVGGREPEFHVVADPLRLAAQNLALMQVADALTKSNLVTSAGLHEEKDTLYLTLVDGRVHSVADIENMVVSVGADHPVRIGDFARVEKSAEPAGTVVTADGEPSVLVMVRSQPDGSTLDIVDGLKQEIATLQPRLPPGMQLSFFYDQSLLVRDSVHSVWEAIIFGLILSVVIIFAFLKDWGSTLVAVVVIPVTVLVTLLAMRTLHMTFNLMTLGGIASAIGLVIDDAIVVVEAIHTKMSTGLPRLQAVHEAVGEIFLPLTGSTLTPVVVFLPLAFLDGVPGVFFRALAITMTVSLLTSLVLAIALTPALAAHIIRVKVHAPASGAHAADNIEEGGFLLRRVSRLYEWAMRLALGHRFATMGLCALLALGAVDLYNRLQSDLLPTLEEHGFVLDYVVKPAGTSLAESNRSLMEIERLLKDTPEVESYSRRTGVALGLELTEPNAGDFLVKLRPDSKRSSANVMEDLRGQIAHLEPQIDVDFHGMLGDLIGDLVSSPKPIEIKVFSTDLAFLKQTAPAIQAQIDENPKIADTEDGIVVAGPSLTFRVRSADAQRFGLTASDIADAVEAAKLGHVSSHLLQADRLINLRVMMDPASVASIDTLKNVPLKTPDGQIVRLSQVADVVEEPGQLELWREDQRQFVAVTGELPGGDLAGTIDWIKSKLANDPRFPPGAIEFGGLYKQQQESFHNLLIVMLMAILLIFTVLVLEFRSFLEPIAIVFGALLALIGTVAALYLTGTSDNIISHLGAIIGVGIVAKNGILMLDYVEHLLAAGMTMEEALVRSGRRRLRPVLMTSLAAALGMLPLAHGIGSGADMLRPLAIAVIGALCISVLLSLVATPTLFYLMYRLQPSRWKKSPAGK